MKKLIIAPSQLKAAFKKLQQVISNKPVIPVLSNILFKITPGSVKLIASDIEITIVYVCEAETKDEFEMLVPFDLLKGIVSLTTARMIFELHDGGKNRIKILGDKDQYMINAEDHTLFPKIPDVPKKNRLELDENFIQWLGRAMSFVSTDELKPSMTKACLEITATGTTLAATDAHSLFRYTLPDLQGAEDQILISPKMAKALEGVSKAEMTWKADHVSFKADQLTVIATRHNDKFPNYSVVIPNTQKNVNIDRNELVGALNRVCLINNQDMVIDFSGGDSFSLKAHNDLEMDTRVEVTAHISYNPEPIRFNPKIMLRVFLGVDFGQMDLHIDGPRRGVLVSSDEDPNYLAMIMPLAV